MLISNSHKDNPQKENCGSDSHKNRDQKKSMQNQEDVMTDPGEIADYKTQWPQCAQDSPTALES